VHPRGTRRGAAIAIAGIALAAASHTLAAQDIQSITVEQASRLAQSSVEAIRMRELAVQKARLAVDEAAGRAWPHVDLQVSGSYLVNPPSGYTVKAGALGAIDIPALSVHTPMPQNDFTIGAQLHNYFSITASLSQPLFTWGKIRNAIAAAALRVDAAGTDLVGQRRDIERDIRRAYFSALLAGESEKVLRRIAESAALIVADRRIALDEGSLTRESVLEAQSQSARIESRLVEAEQGRATALENLGVLTGLDPSSITLASGFGDDLPSLDEQSLRLKARDASVDIAASRTRQDLARKKLDIERGGSILRPDVSLGMSLSVTGQEDLPYSALQWNASTWNWDLVISVGVKMSVFDGMESTGRIGQAEKDVEIAGQALLQAEKLTRLAVRNATDAAIKAEADLAEKRAQEAWAAERLRNAQVSADNGMASREDLHGAQILLGTAQLDRLLAQFTREQARADIARLTGETR
jgi:outer membrane protein TolC